MIMTNGEWSHYRVSCSAQHIDTDPLLRELFQQLQNYRRCILKQHWKILCVLSVFSLSRWFINSFSQNKQFRHCSFIMWYLIFSQALLCVLSLAIFRLMCQKFELINQEINIERIWQYWKLVKQDVFYTLFSVLVTLYYLIISCFPSFKMCYM
jgi:hypothetical protein